MDMQAPYTAPCVQLWLTCSPKSEQACVPSILCTSARALVAQW